MENLKIHGSILLLFTKFIEHTFDKDIRFKWAAGIGTSYNTYDMHSSYPLAEFNSSITMASKYTGISQNDMLEKFGEYLVPDLLNRYKAYINPAWKTFQMLENTELVMHKAVRKEENHARPPILKISRVHDNLIFIDYYSERKMASLAVGIINGIAKFYDETDKVHTIRMSNPNDERVQIKVEFK